MLEKRCSTGLRHYRRRDEVQQLVAEYEASGLTMREFCRQKNIPPNTLGRYLKRYGRQAVVAEGCQQWVAVEVSEPHPAGSGVALVLRSGRRIEVAYGFDAATLERLVKAVEQIG
jgi:hypothetical protein